MAIRDGPRGGEQVSIKFSNDSVHWTAPRPLPGIAAYSNYSQAPGLVAVPGGLVLSHGGKGRGKGIVGAGKGKGTEGTEGSEGSEGGGGLHARGHGDGNGCDLFHSVET